jgi:hypothetical protein
MPTGFFTLVGNEEREITMLDRKRRVTTICAVAR